jgi:hypothetical protein
MTCWTFNSVTGSALGVWSGGGFVKLGVAAYGTYGLGAVIAPEVVTAATAAVGAEVGVGYSLGSRLILSPQEIGSPHFIRINPITGRGPMAIDTSGFTSGSGTMNGGVRNARQFWKQWQSTYTATLSDDNLSRIKLRGSPVIDDVWASHFPEHAGYEGEILIHHHLDYGPLAIPLPGSVHGEQPGWGVWHPDHKGK